MSRLKEIFTPVPSVPPIPPPLPPESGRPSRTELELNMVRAQNREGKRYLYDELQYIQHGPQKDQRRWSREGS